MLQPELRSNVINPLVIELAYSHAFVKYTFLFFVATQAFNLKCWMGGGEVGKAECTEFGTRESFHPPRWGVLQHYTQPSKEPPNLPHPTT